ncbi:nucleoid-associated protein YejK [Vibrio hippocampi]|uniref:Nucleoid-associated protein VHP8226_01007 n=1 Tax=Vibrio hippocampi TaxID=654686 RepID=A0ABM8ZGH5_9VIBR|nr:nucleoid-associated protein YejK [Vibrio hippocampi]CAH0525482.1 Nucleoid-associated protein YejK [Vibrio hippocampi]
MSLNLSNVILHQLAINDQEQLEIHFRQDVLNNDAATENLVAELHRVFNAKSGKGFGAFADDSQFQGWLNELLANNMDFYTFSSESTKRLRDELAKYPFAESGTLVLAQYQSLATDFLFIGLLPSYNSLQVTEGLNIDSIHYLDIAKMDIVARIDLTAYQMDKESNRYLSYIKGRVGRKVADFFLDFLQAEVGLDTKQQNTILMQALDDFCSDSQLDKQETISYKKQAFDYCNEQLKSGDEVQIQELSGELPSNQGASFLDYTQERGYELEQSFPADRATVRKLTKFVGAGGGLNVSFDSLLLGERVFYDPDTDTLTIKGTPPNLKDQLLRNS